MNRVKRFLDVIVHQVISSAKLAADPVSFIRLAADIFLYRALRHHKLKGFNERRTIKLRGDVTITYRLNRGDIWTIYEVWMQNAYRLARPPNGTILIDLGGNIGLTSVWLAKEYGFSRVLLVEPAGSNADLARKNLNNNGIEATVVEAAAGATDGKAQFCETSWSTHNFLVSAGDSAVTDKASQEIYEVPVMSMATLLAMLPRDEQIGLVKLDVEGAEQEILTGDLGWLDRVDSLIVEFHPPHADVPGLIQRLKSRGYEHIAPGAVSGCSMHTFVASVRSPQPCPT